MSLWLQVTSGRGPEECEWVAARVVEKLQKEGEAVGLKVQVLESVRGNRRATIRSALLSIEGENYDSFSGNWQGTIQWIGQSPYRSRHKRKNWFVGVKKLSLPKASFWDEKDLKVEVMRSSGPGGQHVNKTESAVRVTHVPTGTSAIAREERSQAMNRKLALARLWEQKEKAEEVQEGQHQKNRWEQHNQLVRGNPTKVFKGENFIRITL